MISLDVTIDRVKDDFVRGILKVCQRRREYPQDCINDGALQKLAQYIVDMEEREEYLEKKSGV